MKNPQKQFFEAERLKKLSSVLVLECGLKRMPTNHQLWGIAQKMSIEAQEEMGRQNKRAIQKETKQSSYERKGKYETKNYKI